ncbi:MAG: DUF2330 domain-containing protein, partial [Myxococcales bacterium]|nr:DUF2330 domain-containing protein [Myxococcales bacterium]
MLALIALAVADPCGMVPPAWVPAGTPGIQRQGDQETYVFFADGVETIAIRPGFTGTVDEFGMLIPVPAAPALRKIADATFTHLAAAVDPPSFQVSFYDPRMVDYAEEDMAMESEKGSGGPPPSAGLQFDEVRVVNQEAMGMYEVAVLEAGSPKALERWMTERDYRYPDGMDDVVNDYVRSGWLFVAVKTRVQQAAGVEPRPGMRSVKPGLPKGATFNGAVQGMAFRFRVSEPVVPMRLSTFNGDTAVNRVYMLADRPVRVKDRPESLVVRQVDGSSLFANVAQPLPVTYSNGTEEDLPAQYREQLATLRDPAPHNGVARDLMASDLLSVRRGELALPFETREKELLNLNEALGLRGAEVD